MEQLLVFIENLDHYSRENDMHIAELLSKGWVMKQISAGKNARDEYGCYVLLEREKA